ncbi:MAG: hypothetical protein ACOYXB_12120 [Bacteroidota bacterium]
MRKAYLIFFLLVTGRLLSGQVLELDYSFGYGNNTLDDLRVFQTEMRVYAAEYPMQSVKTFPPYFNHSLSADFMIASKHGLGVIWTYMTTGARNSLADYSGAMAQDYILNGHKFGVAYKRLIPAGQHLNFYVQLRFGLISSKLKIHEWMRLYETDYTFDDYNDFKSTGLFMEPRAGVRYFITKNLALHAGFGYESDTESDLWYKIGDEKYSPVHGNGDRVKLDWSGYRASVGLTLAL